MDRHLLHRQHHQAQPDVDTRERAGVLAKLAAGRSLADVLDGATGLIGSMPVRDLLAALPGVDRIHTASSCTHCTSDSDDQ
jgi:hypothetical protein